MWKITCYRSWNLVWIVLLGILLTLKMAGAQMHKSRFRYFDFVAKMHALMHHTITMSWLHDFTSSHHDISQFHILTEEQKMTCVWKPCTHLIVHTVSNFKHASLKDLNICCSNVWCNTCCSTCCYFPVAYSCQHNTLTQFSWLFC